MVVGSDTELSTRGPIYVDLDGTLIRTDIFAESALRLVKSNPLNLFRLIGWIIRGRSVAKARLARRDRLDVRTLPFNQAVVEYLTEQRKGGRGIVLATAAHWRPARGIARHLGIFDDVIASDAHHNLKGTRKLERILEATKGQRFVYCGDNRSDRPLWDAASAGIFVNAPRRDRMAASRRGAIEKEFVDRTAPAAFVRALRPHQWAKNALLAVPLLTSHTYGNVQAVFACAIAFVCFCMCASGVYLANDLFDLDSDRKHRTKYRRPFAAGLLSLSYGVAGALVLPTVAFALAVALLPLKFAFVMLCYFLLTNAYSLKLKTISTLDVFALSGLYTLRTIAGAVAINVVLSSWLLLFSLFFFLSLAYLKRYSELLDLSSATVPGRGYSATDKDSMFALGVANGVASILVMALYVQSEEVRRLYAHPNVLLLVCLGLLYWLNRVWIGARRGKIDEDPVVFAFRDRVSRGVGILLLVVVVVARYAPSHL
jgi:4-hydroxybenzoate polyprenyltransferase/phosphoserine phosphatase